MNSITTDKHGNIKLNNVVTGWTIEKTKSGWITSNFNDEKSNPFKKRIFFYVSEYVLNNTTIKDREF